MRFSVDITESNRGLEPSTLVLVPLIVVDLATNVTPVIFLAPPGCSAGYGTSAITCSTGASIASWDINSIALVFWYHVLEIATRLTRRQ